MSVFIPIPKKGNPKECANYHTIALNSHTRKVMLKILQARLQQYVNHQLPDILAGFRKGRGTRDQLANICLIIEKARAFQKLCVQTLHFLNDLPRKDLQCFVSLNVTWLWDENMQVLVLPGEVIELFWFLFCDLKLQQCLPLWEVNLCRCLT